MKNGVHTIRGGFTSATNPADARRYILDNGDFEKNMRIASFEVFPIGTDPTNPEDFGNTAVMVAIGTSAAGVIPTASTTTPAQYNTALNLRPSDSRQIGWGIITPSMGLMHTILDPDHILPGDLYINAWGISSGGSLEVIKYPIGFIIRMEQVKSSGTEALLYQIKENQLD